MPLWAAISNPSNPTVVVEGVGGVGAEVVELATIPSLARNEMPPWAAISELSNLMAVVEGVGNIGAEVAELAELLWERVMPSLARTAGCEIDGERRFSRLVERVFEDKVFLI